MATINKINSAQTAQRAKKEADDAGRTGLWCWIALALIIICSVVIRGRLLSVPLERDEGEYAYIAQQMLKGVPPYVSAYSMKLPGIYAVYAAIFVVFGQTHTTIHLGLLIANLATVFLVFVLGRMLFGSLAGVAAAGSFAIMSLTRAVLGLSANTEHFVIVPVLVALILIARPREHRRLISIFIAGLLFGLAFIIKQHGMFFSVFGAGYLLYCDLRQRPVKWARPIITQLVFMAGVVLPFAFVCLAMWKAGVFDKFWFWVFIYAGKYATAVPLSFIPGMFGLHFVPLVSSTILIWAAASVGIFVLIFSKRFRKHACFTIGLLLFSFLCTCPGFYFREHYFILLLPAVAILAGAGFSALLSRREFIVVFTGVLIAGFSLFQQRLYLFQRSPVDTCRWIYGTNPFPESVKIAEYLKLNSEPNDTIVVMGSEPQIYFYSGRKAATSYIYTYPLMERQKYATQMQEEMISQIETVKPEFLILVSVYTSWLSLPESNNHIIEWADKFAQEYYGIVGITDIVAMDRTIYRWGQQAVDYKPVSEQWLAVYRRKH